MEVMNFYDEVDDKLLRFSVIIAKTEDKYVFCKHKDRNTWEVPGGHREPGENYMRKQEWSILIFSQSLDILLLQRIILMDRKRSECCTMQILSHSKQNYIVKWKRVSLQINYQRNGHIQKYSQS